MPSITYTALRELEASGYAKGGTDISAEAADDSFNAASTDLAGLAADEWILVAGFVNAANNGFFHIDAPSVTAKVTQDTSSGLVNEAAGPNVTLTGYKRGYGEDYSMDFDLETANRQTRDKKSPPHQPIGGGQPETLFYRSEKALIVRTGLIEEAELGQWREFLASVAGGELFTFDRYGTAAAPVEPKVAYLESNDWTEEREGVLYPGFYRIGFTIRLLT